LPEAADIVIEVKAEVDIHKPLSKPITPFSAKPPSALKVLFFEVE